MSQEDSPTTSFRPFFNPATGEWITYTAIAKDNNGQLAAGWMADGKRAVGLPEAAP